MVSAVRMAAAWRERRAFAVFEGSREFLADQSGAMVQARLVGAQAQWSRRRDDGRALSALARVEMRESHVTDHH